MPKQSENTPLGDSVGDIVDRASKLIHEEIELAKVEMATAFWEFVRGSVAAIVGGVFAFFGLFIMLIACSFLVADAIGVLYPWLGFFIVAIVCFVIGLILAVLAFKKWQIGYRWTPTQAIDEARQTRSALKVDAEKPVDSIDSTAVEEPTLTKPVDRTFPVVGDVKPVVTAKPIEDTVEVDAVAEAKEELDEAREAADELELDAKEAKRRAKQEAKEAKEAAKAARKAEAEAAKAEAIAAKEAEQLAKEAAKAKAKADKDAAKAAKKDAKTAAKNEGSEPEPSEPQRYVAPHPPTEPQPPTPPSPQGPPAPPSDPTESN